MKSILVIDSLGIAYATAAQNSDENGSNDKCISNEANDDPH